MHFVRAGLFYAIIEPGNYRAVEVLCFMARDGSHSLTKRRGAGSGSVDRVNRLLRGLPFFASLTDEEFRQVANIRSDVSFTRGQTILSEKQTTQYIYIVLSGKVKVVHYGPDGKEHILALHKRGDFFGEMAVLDGKTAPAAVVAMEAAEISFISKEDFEEHLMTNRKISRQIINLLCARLRDAWMMLIVLTLPDAEDKVRAVLKLVSIQHGVNDDRGTVIAAKLTHQDIADYADLSRETVTRLLGKFIRAGEIESLDNRNLLLKPGFLEKSYFLLPGNSG